ncbi:uncharacterized protein BP5553_04733 [Venustampulla echinocandica]|uniref:Uncharacterized protein n=1 Tax=Venustampulla echinocandica TaxID=2656787 RepID=A0A370TP54_9HELO|nr:uncharacterized protein BP5553_04733 [Venustampulla echinocandica]RDL37300.1 hypothetical protein BP5553_04733 [Venustampulla echinocandica]
MTPQPHDTVEMGSLDNTTPQISLPDPVVLPPQLEKQEEIQEIQISIPPHPPFASTSSTSSSNTSNPLDACDFPPKTDLPILRSIRHHVASIYRRIFTLILLLNILIPLLSYLSSSPPPLDTTALTACAINLSLTILIRQERIINALYFLVLAIPRSTPLSIRRRAAKVYHLGGVHSGGAFASLDWLFILTILSSTTQNPDAVVLGVAWSIVVLLGAMIITAVPGSGDLVLDSIDSFDSPVLEQRQESTCESRGTECTCSEIVSPAAEGVGMEEWPWDRDGG